MAEAKDSGWIEIQAPATLEAKSVAEVGHAALEALAATEAQPKITPADEAAHALHMDTEVFLEG